MAKKTLSPTEMSVEDRLKALYQLQQTLTAIDEKRALRGELPLEVQDLEDELEGLNTRIEKIMAEIQELETAMSEKKIAIEQAQTKIAQYKDQLNDVRNNREYDTLSKEIEYQGLEIELCNKRIRENIETIEDMKARAQNTLAEINERQSDLDVKRGELDELWISEAGKSSPGEILAALSAFDAEGRPIWKPMHMQPIYRSHGFVTANGNGRGQSNAYIAGSMTDVGADIFRRGLCLPSDNKMPETEQNVIIDIIHRCFE